MSSILDALNKLEQDRAHAQRSSEDVEVDPASAAQELIVPSVLRDRITLRFSPLTLILGGLACALILVSFSVAAALLFVRTPGPEAAAVSDAAAQDTALAARDTAPGAAVPLDGGRPVDEPVTIAAPSDGPRENVPSAAVAVKAGAPGSSALVGPEDKVDAGVAPAVVAGSREALEVAPVREAAPVRAMTPPPVEAAPPEETQMAKAEAAPRIKDVASVLGTALRTGIVAPQERMPDARPPEELTILTKAGQLQYADGPLMINMVRPASETNPHGYSVINKMKVYEGQTIPRTSLLLVEVELDGITVSVQGSGQRYYIEF